MTAVIAIVAALSLNAVAKKGEQMTGVVNINSATVEELVLIPGIGQSKAGAIVEYRQTAKFNSTEDLMKVKGIGEKLFANIRPYVTVNGPTTAKMVKDNSIRLEAPTDGEEG